MFDIIKTNFNLNEKQIQDFNVFYNLLTEWNKKFNLTSITDEKEVEIKQFYDSLMGNEYFFKNANVIEIGSGGGFPSIPLMILKRDLKFTLIESVAKKCTFLNEVIKTLNLNAKVINIRAEDIDKYNLRESFDIVTARAVARLNTLSEYCIPFIKENGLFIAYKGSDILEEEEAKNAVTILGCKKESQKKYELINGEGTRNI